ncbi:MAG: hypothetical protein AB7S26_29720 [Sandaracinaceae bacterium]
MDGVLREERESTTWIARCALEPTARAAGRRYAMAHASSPLAARVRSACAETIP